MLEGVTTAERHGDSVILRCSDSDRAIRALLGSYPAARDIEITGAALEDAFIELTSEDDRGEASDQVMEVVR
jgi:ABC-2 type transport system ATP-binding protein